jgi:hypothetical protein
MWLAGTVMKGFSMSIYPEGILNLSFETLTFISKQSKKIPAGACDRSFRTPGHTLYVWFCRPIGKTARDLFRPNHVLTTAERELRKSSAGWKASDGRTLWLMRSISAMMTEGLTRTVCAGGDTTVRRLWATNGMEWWKVWACGSGEHIIPRAKTRSVHGITRTVKPIKPRHVSSIHSALKHSEVERIGVQTISFGDDVFWDAVQCSPIEVDTRDAYWLRHQGAKCRLHISCSDTLKCYLTAHNLPSRKIQKMY